MLPTDAEPPAGLVADNWRLGHGSKAMAGVLVTRAPRDRLTALKPLPANRQPGTTPRRRGRPTSTD